MVNLGVTGVERVVDPREIIVSKTDLKGNLTYCNDVFLAISDYRESELMGRPHNMLRHPAMPRCAFKLIWESLKAGQEIFAYVVNRTKHGDHYWVFAHITPDVDEKGAALGYHSNRRSADPKAREVIEPLYAALVAEEARHGDRTQGMTAANTMLDEVLMRKGVRYDQFVLGL